VTAFREAPALPSPPGFTLPVGVCDAHTHVFESSLALPPAEPPAYPLPEAPIATHRAVAERLGLARGVLVQPAAYGGDHSAMLHALAAYPDTLRGVALADTAVSDATLDTLHEEGVRSLRFVEMRMPGSDRRYPGSISIAALEALAPRLSLRGWHAEIWADVATCAMVVRHYSGLGLPLVFDHLAGAIVTDDANGADYRTVCNALRSGHAWAKLSLCRVGPKQSDYPLARPFHDALVAANPDRLVWGSDFPFLRKGAEAPDAGWLLDTFRDWIGDDALVRRILADNPATLYDFKGTADE